LIVVVEYRLLEMEEYDNRFDCIHKLRTIEYMLTNINTDEGPFPGASLGSYDRFTEFWACGKGFPKKSNARIST